MSPIIAAEHVSKQFRIGTANSSYQTLRDVLIGRSSDRCGMGRVRLRRDGHTLWALRDVSFGDNLMKIVMLRGTFISIQRNRN